MSTFKKILARFVSEKTYTKITALYIKIVLWGIGFVFRSKRSISITSGNFKIVIDPKNGFTDKMLFKAGFRDKEITDVMNEYLVPGSVFVDIGMNIGYETLWAASLVKQTGSVYAFEPLKRLVTQVNESIHINRFQNIHIIQKALGDKGGLMDLYIHEEDAGLSSLVYTGKIKEVIEVSTLDKELGNLAALNLIKIDIEGFEFEALRGGLELIKRLTPTIIFEFTPHLYEKSERGKSLKLISFLQSLNYDIYILSNNEKSLLTKEMVGSLISTCLDRKQPVNLLALQREA